MGVKGLLIYGEARLGKKITWREHAGGSERGVLLVDGYGMLRRVYHGDWMRGGQWSELKNETRTFIDNFKRVGIRTIWVFDGSIDPPKRGTWVKRRKRDATKVAKALAAT